MAHILLHEVLEALGDAARTREHPAQRERTRPRLFLLLAAAATVAAGADIRARQQALERAVRAVRKDQCDCLLVREEPTSRLQQDNSSNNEHLEANTQCSVL